MFKFTSNYILGALLVFASASGIASAAPSMLEARNTDVSVTITVCIDPGYGHCITFPVVTDTCTNFTGGISGYNKAVSSATIPIGFSCTFYRQFSCLTASETSAVTPDDVILQGGDYPNFTTLPGDGVTADFNDAASSFTCSPL